MWKFFSLTPPSLKLDYLGRQSALWWRSFGRPSLSQLPSGTLCLWRRGTTLTHIPSSFSWECSLPRKETAIRSSAPAHPPPTTVWGARDQPLPYRRPCRQIDLKQPDMPVASAPINRSWLLGQEEESFPRHLTRQGQTIKTFLPVSNTLFLTHICHIRPAGFGRPSSISFRVAVGRCIRLSSPTTCSFITCGSCDRRHVRLSPTAYRPDTGNVSVQYISPHGLPHPEQGVPSWDVSVVLEGLMVAPLEPLESAPERILIFKVPLLLALTSLKRVGTCKLSLSARCVWTSPRVWSRWPYGLGLAMFQVLSASLSGGHIHSSGEDEGFTCSLLSKHWRSMWTAPAIGGNLPCCGTFWCWAPWAATSKQEFLTGWGMLFHWLMRCVVFLHLSAFGHILLGAWLSQALFKGVPLEDICGVAGWSSPHTFSGSITWILTWPRVPRSYLLEPAMYAV